MRTHEVKTWIGPFEDLKSGVKTFEYRYNDREYAVGDLIVHNEWNPDTRTYTGRTLATEVRHMISEGFGIATGHCVMSVVVVPLPNMPKSLGWLNMEVFGIHTSFYLHPDRATADMMASKEYRVACVEIVEGMGLDKNAPESGNNKERGYGAH